MPKLDRRLFAPALLASASLLALTSCAPAVDAPVADAGFEVIGAADKLFLFDGSESEGEALSYRWTLGAVPEGSDAELLDADTAYPTLIPDLLGDYELVLEACDDWGQCDLDVTRAIVIDPAQRSGAAPIADAGADTTGAVGASVALDASGSSDPEGDTLSFGWSFKNKPATSALVNGDISGRFDTTASFLPDVDGVYVIRLKANDGTSQDIDTMNVSVGSGTNNPPTADAGPDQTVTAGDTVSLDATGSTDPDGDALTYVWVFQSKPAGSTLVNANISDRKTANASFVPDVDGDFILKVFAKDGLLKDPDKTTITVLASGNSAPISDAGVDQTGLLGDTVLLDGTGASDPDGDALIYNWTFATTPPASALVNGDISDRKTDSASFVPDVSGIYTVRLRVDDPSGEFDKDTTDVTIYSYTFDDDIQPLFDSYCISCHGGGSPTDGMNLETGAYSNIVNVASKDISAMDRVEPFDAGNSYLFLKIEGTHRDAGGLGGQMPKGGPYLSASEQAMVEDWINEGAVEAL